MNRRTKLLAAVLIFASASASASAAVGSPERSSTSFDDVVAGVAGHDPGDDQSDSVLLYFDDWLNCVFTRNYLVYEFGHEHEVEIIRECTKMPSGRWVLIYRK